MDGIDGVLRDLIEAVVDLAQSHADMEARHERTFRKGKITDVDATKGLARMEIGLDADGSPVKSPWFPYSQVAGDFSVHSPPSVGEQYMLINPDGSPDFSQGVGIPHGWYDGRPSPSTDPSETVAARGTTKDTTKSGSRVIAADDHAALNVQKDGWVMATVKGTAQFVIFDAKTKTHWTINPDALLPVDKPPEPT